MYIEMEDIWWLIKLAVVVGLCVFGVHACNTSDWYQASQRAEAAQAAANRKPHVIREADGCKVYAFTADGRTHFFTRCPDSRTSTESSWTESHGKTHVTKTETIENN
jgi:hypothetical protein